MSTRMHHKGYTGSVLYSEEDRMYHGRLLLSRDFVTYGGEDLMELERNFRDATDEYLAFCEIEGKQPNDPTECDCP